MVVGQRGQEEAGGVHGTERENAVGQSGLEDNLGVFFMESRTVWLVKLCKLLGGHSGSA